VPTVDRRRQPGLAATFGLTSSMQTMAPAIKMALKIQIEDWPVRSINCPARIGPVIAADDVAN
jgi:hypothetical protein